MSSREIAELVKSRHDSVKRAIERLADKGVIVRPPLVDTPIVGAKRHPFTEGVYHVGKRDSYVIVAQLSPEFTGALVDRWQALEEQAAAAALPPPPAPQVPPMPGTLHPEDIAEELAKFLADKDQVTNADLLEALWPGEPWQQDRASILGKIMKKHFRNWFRRRVGYPQARAWCYVRSRKGERPALPAPQPTDMRALPAPDDRLFTDLDFRIAAGEALNQYMQACWDAGRAGTPAPPPSGEALLMIANGLYGRALNRRQFLVTFRQPFELRPLPLTAAVVDPASRGDIEALVGKRVPIGLIPEIVAQCMARLMPQG
nr:Rha family transcriptional regulator [Methylomagnum ishizawai]